MVILVNNYDDFKTMVNNLTVNPTNLAVFDTHDGDFWSAYAFVKTEGIAVIIGLSTGEPASFEADFNHTDLTSTIQVE